MTANKIVQYQIHSSTCIRYKLHAFIRKYYGRFRGARSSVNRQLYEMAPAYSRERTHTAIKILPPMSCERVSFRVSSCHWSER